MKLLLQIIEKIFAPIDWLGHLVMKQAYFLNALFELAYLSTRSALFERHRAGRTIISESLEQTYFTGFQALPIITVLAMITGAASILQFAEQLNIVGSRAGIGDFLIVVVVRELAPLLTGLIVIARSGTAVATQIASMKANGEIEALESMGIHPLSYIVFPRLIGGVASVVSLTFYFGVAALVGGYFITSFFSGLDLGFYLESVSEAMEVEDLILFFVKTVFNGLFIFLICSWYALGVKGSHHEVPQQTTRAVMRSLSYVIFFNIEATLVFYLIKFAFYGWL